jgi:type IV pilus assembly protein PilY1
MIYFGTGKYFETGDNVVPTSPQVQSFYAIWDICDKTSATTCNGSVSGRSVLQEQKILVEGSNGSTTIAGGITIPWDLRVTSNCQVGFGSTAPTTTTSPCTNAINRRGWYLDLLPPTGTASAERSVSTPILRNGRVIFTTLIPNNTTCTPGGTSWLMELDQNTGTRLTGTPFDINNDGKVDDHDMALLNNSSVSASGLKSKVGIIDSPAIVACEDGLDCKYASGSSGELMTVRESAPTGGSRGGGGGTVLGKRVSWRQLR